MGVGRLKLGKGLGRGMRLWVGMLAALSVAACSGVRSAGDGARDDAERALAEILERVPVPL